MTAAQGTLTCGMCARPFGEDRGQASCQACPLSVGCRFVRCPHCGYENPVEPPWLLKVRRWLERDEPR